MKFKTDIANQAYIALSNLFDSRMTYEEKANFYTKMIRICHEIDCNEREIMIREFEAQTIEAGGIIHIVETVWHNIPHDQLAQAVALAEVPQSHQVGHKIAGCRNSRPGGFLNREKRY